MRLLVAILVCLILVSCSKEDPAPVTMCLILNNAKDIAATGATLSGESTCTNGLTVTEHGFYWGSTAQPEQLGTKVVTGSGTGSFSTTLTGLSSETVYYFKAYVQTSAGVTFGAESSFTTTPLQMETFTDPRDGKVYKIVQIGTQTWMAENLNYSLTGTSYCYDDAGSNCVEYGRLYTWSEALTAVPAGWHMPTKSEFETLISHYSSPEEAFNQLKAGGCGFQAKFAGIRNHESPTYFGLGSYADFWSSTEQSADWVYILDLNTTDQIAIVEGDRKARGFSLRCVKN